MSWFDHTVRLSPQLTGHQSSCRNSFNKGRAACESWVSQCMSFHPCTYPFFRYISSCKKALAVGNYIHNICKCQCNISSNLKCSSSSVFISSLYHDSFISSSWLPCQCLIRECLAIKTTGPGPTSPAVLATAKRKPLTFHLLTSRPTYLEVKEGQQILPLDLVSHQIWCCVQHWKRYMAQFPIHWFLSGPKKFRFWHLCYLCLP